MIEALKPIVVIPARIGSKRLPGKPLALINGIPMIVRVLNQAKKIPGIDQVIVATDCDEIIDVVDKAGGWAMLTSKDHKSGTDRVAEVVKPLPPNRLVLNIQGDLPFFNPEVGSALISAMHQSLTADMATPVVPMIGNKELFEKKSVVKVAFALNNKALYFSRSQIPSRNLEKADTFTWYKHIGVYIYRNKALQTLTSLQQTALEKSENLEQLRALEHGMNIRVVCTAKCCGQEVNTPDDLRKANGS